MSSAIGLRTGPRLSSCHVVAVSTVSNSARALVSAVVPKCSAPECTNIFQTFRDRYQGVPEAALRAPWGAGQKPLRGGLAHPAGEETGYLWPPLVVVHHCDRDGLTTADQHAVQVGVAIPVHP